MLLYRRLSGQSWQNQVPTIEVNTHSVTQTDVVIPTLDTVRHEDVLYSWLAEHKPLLLCGPPGSGKTMTLFSALAQAAQHGGRRPQLLQCHYARPAHQDVRAVLRVQEDAQRRHALPDQIGRWLVIFCDEINLPAPDKYGTQRAISFLRQLVEQNGFWRTSDKTWVTLDRIQFVGACNPPTDAGRTPMGARFLRHAPLIMVDYPGETLAQPDLWHLQLAPFSRSSPSLRGYSEALTQGHGPVLSRVAAAIHATRSSLTMSTVLVS